jgi:hypothetical protein
MWVQEMKCPPFGEKEILDSVKVTPMTSAEWQALQNPENMELDPGQGKFRWDGKFVANAKVMGDWAQVAQVNKVEDFQPSARPSRPS